MGIKLYYEIWSFIKELKNDRVVVFTTHYIGDAEANCDRVALMSRGRILDVGTPRELIQKYFAESLGEVMLEKGT